MRKKIWKKILTAVLTAAVMFGPVGGALQPVGAVTVEAASRPASAVTVNCGKTVSLAFDSAVKYTTSNKKVATVNSKGLVTGKKEGRATITIKTKAKTYRTKVTVKRQQAAIEVKSKTVKLAVGEKLSLQATSQVRLTYKARNKYIKVDSKGNITGVRKGTSSVKISGKSTGTYRAPKSVTVKVTITDPEIRLQYGKTGSVKTKNAKKYVSSNTGIVKVDGSGKLTPVKAGSATVKVTVGKTTKSYKVIVDKADYTISVDRTAAEVLEGKTLQLKAAGKTPLTYKADNSNITVDKYGKITGKNAGTATVTITGAATSCYNAPKAVKVKVTVKDNTIAMITNNPESALKVYVGKKTPEAFLQVCNNVATLIVNDGDWVYSNSNNKYSILEARAQQKRVSNCAHFVNLCMQQFGTLPQNYGFYSDPNANLVFKPLHLPSETVVMETVNKYYEVIKVGGKKPGELNLKPGDICCYKSHMNVYAGKNSKGVMTWYDFARSATSDGKENSGSFVRIMKTGNSSTLVYTILRLK